MGKIILTVLLLFVLASASSCHAESREISSAVMSEKEALSREAEASSQTQEESTPVSSKLPEGVLTQEQAQVISSIADDMGSIQVMNIAFPEEEGTITWAAWYRELDTGIDTNLAICLDDRVFYMDPVAATEGWHKDEQEEFTLKDDVIYFVMCDTLNDQRYDFWVSYVVPTGPDKEFITGNFKLESKLIEGE